MKGMTLRYYHRFKGSERSIFAYERFEVTKPVFDKHGRFKYFVTEEIDNRQFYQATRGIECEVVSIEGVNADETVTLYWVNV